MRYSAMGAVLARASVLAAVLVPSLALFAQVHGTPPSVTSLGFGGSNNHAPGVPAGVISPGRFGWSGGHRTGLAGGVNTLGNHHRRGTFSSGYIPVYSYGVPYGTAYFDEPAEDTPQVQYPQDQYLGGPTIFDRRGPGPNRDNGRNDEARSWEPTSPPSAAPAPAPAPVSDADQPQTVLVFRDGHKLEVQNYAIVGATLYNLAATRGRKIALADLDLKATVRENDDRGIDFRLPPGTPLTDTQSN